MQLSNTSRSIFLVPVLYQVLAWVRGTHWGQDTITTHETLPGQWGRWQSKTLRNRDSGWTELGLNPGSSADWLCDPG